MPLLVILLCTGAAARGDELVTRWRTYTNPRFGFSICYPAGLLQRQPPPDNGDGITLTSRDGGRLAAWGSYDVLKQATNEREREDEQRLAGLSGSVTYKRVKADGYVVSGVAEGRVFYSRVILAHGVASAMELSYPVSERAIWDPIAARVSRCLKPG